MSGVVSDLLRRAAMAVLVGVFVLEASGSAQAGGSCNFDTDCNQSPNFCRPGRCSLFNQCEYQHDDAQCQVFPGDNQFCNGVNFCNETLNGGTGGCDINPVNCVPPTPQCNETLNSCVECTNSVHCNPACVGGGNNGLACSGAADCPNGNCPADPDPIRNTCKTSTGVCVECQSESDCTDGLYCTGQETCNPSTGLCVNPDDVTCAPGKFCSEVWLGLCVQCEQNSNCDDGAYCTGVETCNSTTHNCADGADIACKSCSGGTTPGLPCLINGDCGGAGTCIGPSTLCNETNDRCVQCNFNSDCAKDFDYCTNAACSILNSCEQVSNPVAKCGDGLHCNGEEVCLSSQPGSSCAACLIANPNDESVCKTQKRCVGGTHPVCTTDAQCASSGGSCALACCGAGTSVDCEDAFACTMDKCNEATDSCTHAPAAHTCNDTAKSPCDADTDCPTGFICGKKCNNPVKTPCTADANCPAGYKCGLPYCDDGSYCNGQETCGTLGCVNLTPRVCTNSETPEPCTDNSDCPGECSFNSGISCLNSSECPPGDTCIRIGQCQVDCSSLDGPCTNGICDDLQDRCDADPINDFEACNDADPCTINTFCDDQGECLPSTTVNNGYWCVRLEWRNVTPQPVNINDFITADLYAVADGCGNQYSGACPTGNMELFGLNVLLNWNPVPIQLDPPGSPNPLNPCSSSNACYQCQTCSGGSNPGAQCVQRCVLGTRPDLTCLSDAECNGQCVGGTNPGAGCTGNFDCPGGTCTIIAASGTCSSTVKTCLGGGNNGRVCAVAGDCPPDGFGNPGTCSTQFTCQGGGVCSAPPTPKVYSWSTSAFLNDCQSDGINGPCPHSGTWFPGNDGNAVYSAFEQPACDGGVGYPVCVSPAGLFVTKFRFKAIRGGQDQIAIGQCAGDFTKTSVNSAISPPVGLASTDVLKLPLPSAAINVKCNTAADCDDLNVCTTDTCVNQNCERTNNTLSCEDGDFCTPNGVCAGGVCIGSGTRCSSPTPICDETNDRCVQCYTTATCGDNDLCTQDICDAAGLCQHPSVDCGDGVSCTVDTCVQVAAQPGNPAHYECVHSPNNAACATGLFCSAKICDLQLGCVFDHACVSSSAPGNPCEISSPCSEANGGNCGGCLTPAAVAVGARQLKVTPAIGQGTTPVAILVEGDCGDVNIGCVSKYVEPRCVGGANDGQLCTSDANCPKKCKGGNENGAVCPPATCIGGGVCVGSCDKGLVGTAPVYMSASAWGTINVHANEFRPESKYHVYSICNTAGNLKVSAATRVKTYHWGDTDGDGDTDFDDISGVVNAFKNFYSPIQTYQSTNIVPGLGCGDPISGTCIGGTNNEGYCSIGGSSQCPGGTCAICIGQECISFDDISADVDAFKGIAYPCSAPCP